MEYRIGEEEHGKTVLEIVKRRLGISHKHLKHLKFTEGGILVNGEPVTVRFVLHCGDVLAVATEDSESGEKLIPVDLPLTVLYEDNDVVVPAKPAHMPTHPSFGHYEDTVANALAYRYVQQGIPFVFRPVNRLDRNTSGLLLIARNRMAAATLFHAMRSGKIRKLYLAVLEGELPSGDGVIETYMRRTAESIIVREVCGEDGGGDFAKTRYRVLSVRKGRTLVAASPLTGRTHQLRVHFAHLGCPIVGDDLYGRASDEIGRHALHSCVLSFPRPSDGWETTVCAPLPEDMLRLGERLFDELPDEETLISLCEELTREKTLPQVTGV